MEDGHLQEREEKRWRLGGGGERRRVTIGMLDLERDARKQGERGKEQVGKKMRQHRENTACYIILYQVSHGTDPEYLPCSLLATYHMSSHKFHWARVSSHFSPMSTKSPILAGNVARYTSWTRVLPRLVGAHAPVLRNLQINSSVSMCWQWLLLLEGLGKIKKKEI